MKEDVANQLDIVDITLIVVFQSVLEWASNLIGSDLVTTRDHQSELVVVRSQGKAHGLGVV